MNNINMNNINMKKYKEYKKYLNKIQREKALKEKALELLKEREEFDKKWTKLKPTKKNKHK